MSECKITAIALKPDHRAAMEEVNKVEVTERGISGNAKSSAHRRVTFISEEQWADTTSELGTELPWHTRRANVLLSGVHAPDLMGKTLRVGDVEIQVNGETEPCGRMDEIHPGLRKALEPECRGGVYGSVVSGGTLRVGDTVEVSG